MSPDSTEQVASTALVGSAGWRLFLHEVVSSTNDIAREMPPWTAVRSVAQTAGRGRFGRSFVSDRGGLWLSATLPAAGGASQWGGFSLMVGHHLLVALRRVGVPGARLRWPNDLMSGAKKLAGLLIEQGAREVLTVGVGMNVHNTPWLHDPSLANTSTRLADLCPVVPNLEALTVITLDALADAHHAMVSEGLEGAIRELNAQWTACPIEITLISGESINGTFLGLDRNANLRIRTPASREHLIPHHHVARLKELEWSL